MPDAMVLVARWLTPAKLGSRFGSAGKSVIVTAELLRVFHSYG